MKRFPCEIVEVRLDKIGAQEGWRARCEEIERTGAPVLLTVRSKAEGGDGPDDGVRRALLEEALALSAVDIELRSEIAPEIAARAQARGKACVLSYHDFQATPKREELERVIREAEALGGITKIATMIRSPEDGEILSALLEPARRQPLCVIGMGENWTHLRVELAREGSCLTYGYLDSTVAPGQMAAADLLDALRDATF